MKLAAMIGVLAMLPAALNASPAAAGLRVPLCNGGAGARSITIPAAPQLPALPGDSGCCVKGCHGSSSRKRSSCGN